MTMYTILIVPSARRMLEAIKDRRLRTLISERIDGLKIDPHSQGKPLWGDLAGFRAVRAAGQRYRVIYRVQTKAVVVSVVAVGLRKGGSKADIYELARRLVRLRLLE